MMRLSCQRSCLSVRLCRYLIIILCLLIGVSMNAQKGVIKGKITDATNNEPIPFSTVYFKGTSFATTTNFNGEYEIKMQKSFDSITVQYIGYKIKSKALDKNSAVQVIDFQLESLTNELDEIVVIAGENPAWRILRNVVKNKTSNNVTKQQKSLEFHTYTRSEICLDNISEKLKKSFFLGNVATILDNAKKVAGEDGKLVIPIFVSEVISKNYRKTSPQKNKEVVLNSKISGIGIADNTTISQFVGSGLLNINLYNNYSTILTKDLVSPICDEWRLNYKYYLVDSQQINNRFCYEIKFYPRSKFDLAYTGKIWIDKIDYALVRIDAQINKEANINYVDKIKIQQEFIKKDSLWLPSNTRLLIDLTEVADYSSGVLIKTNTRYYDYNTSAPEKPLIFYDSPTEITENDSIKNQNFDSIRPIELSEEEKSMYNTIDSVKNVPKIKQLIKTLDFLVSGYKPIGKIELGPYPYFYSYNQFEQHRLRIGFRTTKKFSNTWSIKGYLAFTTGDSTFIKPEIDISKTLKTKQFCEIGVKYHFDAEQLGISTENLDFNSNVSTSIFSAVSRFGPFNYPYYLDELSFYLNTEVKPGLTQNFTVRSRAYLPCFPFAFRLNPGNILDKSAKDYFQTTEFVYDLRYSPSEMAIRTKRNKRVRIKRNRDSFTYNFKYIYGSKLWADFEYHKFFLGINKSIRLGFLGRSTFDLNMGYSPSTIPLPLLFIHQGNESPVYLNKAFNQMNFLEFVSDKYVSLNWFHSFEGLFFNRVPLIQKWGWRTNATGKILYGDLSRVNKGLQAESTLTGLPITPINSLQSRTPYIELGYGVSNILKCLRIDFVHRLTYLDRLKVHPFGIKLSIEIKL